MREALLGWYDDTARDLPWRRTKDPYAIWVSEIMLQQTRVDTVIPYYEKFLARFPTPAALAEADEDAVLSMWSGLGYYRRARLLHRGVQEVVAEYGGQIPEDAQARRKLPGVGRYTAGAIGSIAFGKEEPIVDGNVSRVLARLFAIRTPLGAPATERRLWELSERLVLGERPGDLNQALMELGATVCTPKQPRCLLCPVSAECQARQAGEADALPVPRPRKVPKRLAWTAVVASRGRAAKKQVFLSKVAGRLFGGLWGVPMAESASSEDPARAALRDAGLIARLDDKAPVALEHVLTHRHLHIEVFRASGAQAKATDAGRFFTQAELDEVGVSSLTKKILAAAGS
jgi:A/G-specific adenine glycosylase